MTVDQVGELVARYGGFECYASIFCFSDEILLYLAEHHVDGRPSIAGYDGRVWAPFLPLDIDAPPPTELHEALELARRTYEFLVAQWQMPAAAVHSYFSGAKGFHLLVDTRAFGRVTPARGLPRIFSRLRLDVLRALPDAARQLFDLAIGDKVRLFRLPNTWHRASGLYKVALSPEELLSASIEEIRSLAGQPRPLTRVGAGGLVPREPVVAAPIAVEQFRRACRSLRRSRGPHPYRFALPSGNPEDALCAARRVMWQSQIKPGNRNNVAIRLASAFRLAGHKLDETRELLFAWNRRWGIRLAERELRDVVHSAYARSYPYAYGCHDEVIRGFCPFTERLDECSDYRESHSRSGRSV